MHPSDTGFAVVAWRSPTKAVVSISGSFTDINANCGNGVAWSVDRGAEILSSGELNGNSQPFDLQRVAVSPRLLIYFVVDAKDGDYFCDSTELSVTITQH